MAQKDIPQLDKTPESCPVCDATLTLGLLTAVCEADKDPSTRGKCLEILKPLEKGDKKAVDILTDVIVELGESGVNDVVERFNLLLFEATDRAKDRLIEKGVLNRDGTPKEMI